MKRTRASVKRWTECFDITEEEFNNALVELGYQVRNTSSVNPRRQWLVTRKGREYCRMSLNPFRRVILWDMRAHMAISNLLGRKERGSMYCEKCYMHLNMQPGFNFDHSKWICTRCGHGNDTSYPESMIL